MTTVEVVVVVTIVISVTVAVYFLRILNGFFLINCACLREDNRKCVSFSI